MTTIDELVSLNAALCEQAELAARQLSLYQADTATRAILERTLELVARAKSLRPEDNQMKEKPL